MGSIDPILALRRRSIAPLILMPKEEPKEPLAGLMEREPMSIEPEPIKVPMEPGEGIAAYVDQSGALYIPTPPLYRTFTAYPSLGAWETIRANRERIQREDRAEIGEGWERDKETRSGAYQGAGIVLRDAVNLAELSPVWVNIETLVITVNTII
jgi:hypothetical protein